MPILLQEPAQEYTHRAPFSDTRLIKQCLAGSDAAWAMLLDKYKNLIFSIPIKYGFSRDESGDIFQAVCLELLSGLPNLRKPEALPKWIMQVTSHKCLRLRREQQRTISESESEYSEPAVISRTEEILSEAEEEQNLRHVLSEMPPRCRQLIHMLFFEEPARPYQDVAESLGIATGSIGFIRQRCLGRLRKRLVELGLS